ncbi:Major facilitator superfamily domain general substrate transporter [Pyrenophora seminiperda CCB06]|uniref:Major facilitator superfamily domain general substrate transporter n=1 Tax=Pyrenophora seminiperda CCB06 TaxID=1302712 RepID=A0A3M7LVU1_9PLEO|nr:Major facilitator superfamily domain general substrate transporter [Pyrenophora seminiperda CCB06]
MVCKSISNIGIGELLVAGITYGAGCAPANKRGLLMGLYNICLAIGNVASAAVCAGSATLSTSNNWQWKTPIACQFPLSLALGCAILLFPDSPRWLLVKGREDEARRALSKFSGLDPKSDAITRQIHDIQSYIEAEDSAAETSSWTEIYRGPDLRRTLVSAFVVPYTALFLEDVGLKNPFVTNVIINVCILAGSFPGPFIMEYGGRRFALLCGYSVMASSMLIFSVVSSGIGAESPVSHNVLVAFLCIWSFAFGAFVSPSA